MNGGVVTQLKSGYSEDSLTKQQRPPISVFPGGFFIEDYTYKDVVDESVLDKNNGRFCVTPEFPNGTYAYFATIDDSTAQGQGAVFAGFKLPKFPYFVGDAYHSKPDEFNYRYDSNQDDFDLNGSDYCRNTVPHNLIDGNVSYPYITTKQTNTICRCISSSQVKLNLLELKLAVMDIRLVIRSYLTIQHSGFRCYCKGNNFEG